VRRKEIPVSKERGGGLIFLAVGVYGLVFSIPLPLGQWNQPGPAVFPLGLSILLCLSGVSWFIHGEKKGEKKEPLGLGGFIRKYITPFRIVGLTAAFILTLDPLGYLLASTIYLFILLLWVSGYRLWIAAVLAIAFGAGSWLFFEKLLATPLPKGFLPF
jgi:putative tricarboxylic transport membrane protein